MLPAASYTCSISTECDRYPMIGTGEVGRVQYIQTE